MASACREHCAHHGDGNGSALRRTTSFVASSCANQCAVASPANGPTPACPTSASRDALSATRATHVSRNAASTAPQNSSSANAAPSETGTTATVRGAEGARVASPARAVVGWYVEGAPVVPPRPWIPAAT